MSRKLPPIITVYQTNPFEDGQGGGVRYVRNLLKGLVPECEETLFFGIGDAERRESGLHLVPITKTITGYVPFLLLLAWKLLWTDMRPFKMVHVHRLYFAIPFLLIAPRLKILCTLHGRTFTVFESNYGSGLLKLVKPFFLAIEKFCLKRIDILVPVSRDVVRSFEAKYPVLMKKQVIHVLGSIQDTSKFTAQESRVLQQKFGTENKYILFLGRMEPVKDIEFLLGVFAKHFQTDSSVKLVLAGAGGREQEYRELASKTCPDNPPEFLGEVQAEDVPALLQSAQVLALCSKHEASPTVIKEALACGLPIVTTLIGDVDEFILEGRNGYIAEKDGEQFASRIRSLLDAQLSRKQVRAVSEEVLHKTTGEYICGEYLKLYLSLHE